MKKVNKLVSLALALVMCLTLAVPAMAASDEEVQALQEIEMTTDIFNEYDYIVEVRNMVGTQRQALDIPSEEITYVMSDAIEDELLYRATLSTHTLKDQYCYRDEQIAILKEYDGGRLEDHPEMRVVTASLSAGLGSLVTGPKRMGALYTWSWDSKPLNVWDDIAAMAWEGTYVNGGSNNMMLDLKTSHAEIHYYYSNSVQPQETYTLESSALLRGGNVRFPMTSYGGSGISFPVWAKSGAMYVYMDLHNPNGPNLVALAVHGEYGHNVTTPNISVSYPLGASIAFDGTVQALGSKNINLRA